MPVCSSCGTRPEATLPTTSALTSLEGKKGYKCFQCKVLKCTLCGEEQESTAFTVTMQKRAAASKKGVRCKDCQMPACSACGTRPEAPLPPRSALTSLEGKKGYKCFQCAFPPCKVCGTEMTRQQRRTFQKRDAASQNEWTCSDCIDKAHNRPHR